VRVLDKMDLVEGEVATSKRRRGSSQLLSYITLVTVGVLVVEFLLAVLLQQRSQQQLTSEFKSVVATAASAIGQSDVSPLPDTAPAYGSPVALLQIPAIGLTQVVVEGVTSNFTQLGPGHVPGTVLPGQAGEAVIVGRRTTFGAPFFKVPGLKPGTEIRVTTVEGPSLYKVIGPKEAEAGSGSNILKLVTSSPPILAFKSETVTAVLQAKPYPDTPKNARTAPNTNQFALMLLLLQVLVLALIASRGIYQRFGAMVGWILIAPLVAGSLVALTLALDTLLPAGI